MKYCRNCGVQMNDDMFFCQKCGTRCSEDIQQHMQNTTATGCSIQPPQEKSNTKKKIIAALLCIYMPYIGLPYVLIKKPFKKKGQMIATIYCIFLCAIVILAATSAPATTPSDTPSSQVEASYNDSSAETTLADVESWYKNQMPAVGQCLAEYASSVYNLSSLNVDSSKFHFGSANGWYDCHYTFVFTCTINGVPHQGEARAFIKYQDDTVNWFHFEIFSNTGTTSVVELYDDSYDIIIENYYKELEKLYVK